MNPTVIPAYLIRSYAWKVLQANDPTVWDENLYDGNIPIVPLNEEPELDAFAGPHIVYGYAESATGSLGAAKNNGATTFAIYDNNFRRLSRTLTILRGAFEREDDTARDINAFTSSLGENYEGIRFGTVSVAFVEGGTPEDSEGGRQSAIISITYDYFVTYDIITSFV